MSPIALSDPSNPTLIDELQTALGKNIIACVAPSDHIEDAIRKHYPPM
jgi:hypothetical protein